MRNRRVIDKAIVGVAVACLAIAVARVTLAIVEVPIILYAAHREAAVAPPGEPPSQALPLADRFAESRPFVSWWGHRRAPVIIGGDYLQVISSTSRFRTVGVAVGVIGRELREGGARIDRILLPSDRARLYGRQPGIRFTRGDGTKFRNNWPTAAQDASYFSDIPVTTTAYDPLISAAQVDALAARTKLRRRTKAVFVASPVPGGSGSWILLASNGKPRRYYFVPLELSPVGSGL